MLPDQHRVNLLNVPCITGKDLFPIQTYLLTYIAGTQSEGIFESFHNWSSDCDYILFDNTNSFAILLIKRNSARYLCHCRNLIPRKLGAPTS